MRHYFRGVGADVEQKKAETARMFRSENHSDRDDLAPEHPYGDLGQIIALIIFLSVWILDSFIIPFSTLLADYVPIYIRLILAGLFFVPAGYLARSGLTTVFKEKRDPPKVINTGVFSFSRHPIYLSALLVYLGFIFTTLSVICLVLFVVIFIFYDYIASFEERQLEEKFGQEYIDYKKKVPKWVLR